MTRKEIIEEAKKQLPSPAENVQSTITIFIQDTDQPEKPEYIPDSDFPTLKMVPNKHHVEFERCLVTDKVLYRNHWGKEVVGYAPVWIPVEYFDFKLSSTPNENETLLNEYLIKPTDESK